MGPKTLWKKSAMLLIIRSYSSYGVESSPRERVATEHPEDAHEGALKHAVLLYGLQRVQGAARRISASRREHGGEVGAVEPDQSYARPSHKRRYRQTGRRPAWLPTLPNDLPNSSRSSSNVAPEAAGFADTTKSRFPEISEIHEWNTSLSLRRTAFRVTALPTLLDTERPSRGVPSSLGKACTEKSLPL